MKKTDEKTKKSPSGDFFQQLLVENKDYIDQNPPLKHALSEMRITNIVATCNLDIKDINPQALAGEHFSCHYHKYTFAALGIRLQSPWCAALLYSMGVKVCMGTKSPTAVALAMRKYVDLMNNVYNIKCNMRGLQIDNYVTSTSLFPLDLSMCTSRDMNKHFEYNENRFSGAIMRCAPLLPENIYTDAVMTMFDTGNINITGAKSTDEAMYLLMVAYKRFIHKMEKKGGTGDKKKKRRAAAYDTEIARPKVIDGEEAAREFEKSNKKRKTDAVIRESTVMRNF